MIIYNLKGLIVAAVSAVAIVISILLKFEVGMAIVFAGVVGLLVSILFTKRDKKFWAQPSVFFIPTHVYTIALIVIGIKMHNLPVSTATKFDLANSILVDSLYERDLELLNLQSESGSIKKTQALKKYMVANTFSSLQAENFHYMINEDTVHKKCLTLMKVNNYAILNTTEKETLIKQAYFFMQTKIAGNNKLYLGIVDENLVACKTNEEGVKIKTSLISDVSVRDFYKN